MWKVSLIFALIVTLHLSCRQTSSEGTSLQSDSSDSLIPDTIIGRKVITNEIAGSAYRKRAMGYFLIHGEDTSGVLGIFTESNDGGRVDFHFRNEDAKGLYRERLVALRKILPEAAKDFRLDSLKSVWIGRLVSNGDIAADVTDEYQQKFPRTSRLDSGILGVFMLQSKLARDFNQLFSPYAVQVKGFSLEKCHFTSRDILLWESKVERDSSAIPEKVVDCATWIVMGGVK